MVGKLTGLLFATAISVAGASAQSAAGLYSCSMDDRRSVYWEAIGETVTLRSELFGYQTFLPEGRQSLIFSDGYELLIGLGGKYIDEVNLGSVPSCDEYLAASNGATLASLSEPVARDVAPFDDMAELDTERPRAEACDANADMYTQHGGLFCEQWDELNRNFHGQEDQYRKLVSQRAPIIAVPYSTGGVDYLAFDSTGRTIHPLFYSSG